jgi:hypothetical protein
LRVEKDANYAVDSPMRQSFRRPRRGRHGARPVVVPVFCHIRAVILPVLAVKLRAPRDRRRR